MIFRIPAIAAAAALLAAFAAAQPSPPDRRQVGAVVLEGVPAIDESLRELSRPYLEFRRAILADVSDDGGGVLVATRFGNTAQLHHVRTPLGQRRQITFFDEPVNGGRFIPGSGAARILFPRDTGGDENFQIYELDRTSGKQALLTDGKSRHEALTRSRDGKLIAFANNSRNGRDMDIYVRDQAAGQSRMLWQVEGSYTPSDFSPDASRLLVQQYLSEKQTRWFIVDVASGEAAAITPDEPPAFYGGAVWSADGKCIYLTTDRDGEFRKLHLLKLDYGEWRCISPDINWDVEEVAADPAGGGIVFATNEDGISKLYLADSWGNGRRAVDTGLPPGVVSGLRFSAAGGVLGFTYESPVSPPDAYTLSLANSKVTRWTESEAGGLNPARFITPTLIRYPTFDQADGKPREIPALYYRAPGDGPRPVVIIAHGGPEGQHQPTFNIMVQLWACEMGISVIAPNVRGSTGYGKTFHGLDNGVHREDSVRDVGALLDWIEKQPELDKTRIGIYGGSYGGYMVLGALMNYPARIKAGIDLVGIADFVSFLERTSEYRRDLRRAEYGDERDPQVRKVLEAISPLRNAQKIQSALFVVHGQNDPRVKVFEAEQIVAKMRELQRPVWFANALDEGHGFQKKINRDLSMVLYLHFWREHLLK